MTRETETLFYNHRMIIDTFVEAEPKAWLISKTNRLSPNGICRVTLTQDVFDQHRDYIECDVTGKVIGMWADYYVSNIEPSPVEPDISEDGKLDAFSSTITCSGKNQIRVGGSSKTLTVSFQDNNGDPIEYQQGEWYFSLDDEPLSNDLLLVTPISDGKVTIKFLGDDEYIGKILQAKFISGDVVSSLNIEIIAL